MKTIVTHQSPDLDALASVWLLRRFRPGWKDAVVEFVSAEQTLNGIEPDRDPDIIHVDTGGGQFDHHETSEFTSAARLVFEQLQRDGHIKETEQEAVERIVDVVTRYDHFKESMIKGADDDMHIFSLAYVIIGHRPNQSYTERLVELTEDSLDGILQYMKSKVHAEHLIKKGHVFTSYWGKTLVLETDNDKAVRVAFMKGFGMVIRYSPNYKNVAIRIHPRSRRRLAKLRDAIVPHDPDAHWFYHASGNMLMNASTRARRDKVTKYSLPQLLKIIRSI